MISLGVAAAKSQRWAAAALFLLIGLLASPTYAEPAMKIDRAGNPVLDQFSEDGFVDCVFKIVDLTETPTHLQFRLVASHKGELVGMRARLVKGIQSGLDEEMNLIRDHVYRRGVVFSRSGPESDRLIAAIAELYGMRASGTRMVDEESFTAIAVHLGPFDLRNDVVKIKIFGRDSDSDHEDDYYESFFNLDLKNKRVFWNEKDPEYRDPLVRALSSTPRGVRNSDGI